MMTNIYYIIWIGIFKRGFEKKIIKKYLIFEIKYNIKFDSEVDFLLNDCHLAISRNSKYLQGLDHLNKFNYI